VLRISYESEDFPGAVVSSGTSELSVTWDDILWAAVTVGRPNRQYVFRHGAASGYEAIFRWSLVRTALEQRARVRSRLWRTTASKTLDPTEKGAISYFLGMTFCKLFAAKLLNTHWLLHLDVFRPALNPVLSGRSRPDLLGFNHGTSRWYAFECKGRISPPGASDKQNAKAQARRLVAVNGTPCALHIGAVTYFHDDVLNFYWRDPAPDPDHEIDVVYRSDDWRHYYAPVLEAFRSSEAVRQDLETETRVSLDSADLQIGMHPIVAKYLYEEQWEHARKAAIEAADEIAHGGYQPDGLKVRAGRSWRQRFLETALGGA